MQVKSINPVAAAGCMVRHLWLPTILKHKLAGEGGILEDLGAAGFCQAMPATFPRQMPFTWGKLAYVIEGDEFVRQVVFLNQPGYGTVVSMVVYWLEAQEQLANERLETLPKLLKLPEPPAKFPHPQELPEATRMAMCMDILAKELFIPIAK